MPRPSREPRMNTDETRMKTDTGPAAPPEEIVRKTTLYRTVMQRKTSQSLVPWCLRGKSLCVLCAPWRPLWSISSVHRRVPIVRGTPTFRRAGRAGRGVEGRQWMTLAIEHATSSQHVGGPGRGPMIRAWRRPLLTRGWGSRSSRRGGGKPSGFRSRGRRSSDSAAWSDGLAARSPTWCSGLPCVPSERRTSFCGRSFAIRSLATRSLASGAAAEAPANRRPCRQQQRQSRHGRGQCRRDRIPPAPTPQPLGPAHGPGQNRAVLQERRKSSASVAAYS